MYFRTFSITAAILCAGLCAASSMAYGQRGVLLGPTVVYEFGVPLTLSRAPGLINRYGFNGQGQSYNHQYAGGLHIMVPDWLIEKTTFSAKLVYGVSEGYFKSTQFTGRARDISSGDSVMAVKEFTVTAHYNVLQLDASISYDLGSRWAMNAGLWGRASSKSDVLFADERILSPGGAVFSNNSNYQKIAAGDTLLSNPFNYGARLGLTFRVPVWGSQLLPEIFTRADAVAISEGLGLRALSAGLGLSVLIDVGDWDLFDSNAEAPPLAAAVDTLRERERKPALEATMDLHVVGADGAATQDSARLRPRNILNRHYMPLLPVIFFEQSAHELPARYVRLAPEAIDTFSRKSLARLQAPEIHHQTLNLIGWRLHSEPDARITLHGSAARGESQALAGRRAEEVAEYLRRVWNIEPSRIEIGKGHGPYDLGKEGERSVQIVSTSDKLMAPVVAEWVEREQSAPQLGLSRSIRSEVGVKRWKITIRQGDAVISSYSSADAEPFTGFDGAFLLRNTEGPAVPIVAEMEVEDVMGNVVTASDQLPVAAGRDDDTESADPAREVLTFTFAGLDRSSTVLARGNRTLMARMVDLMRNEARVTVLDREADDQEGPDRDGWSAGSVAEELIAGMKKESKRAAELKVVPGGLEKDAESAAYPEYALLRAGASVVVEQGSAGEKTRRP